MAKRSQRKGTRSNKDLEIEHVWYVLRSSSISCWIYVTGYISLGVSRN